MIPFAVREIGSWEQEAQLASEQTYFELSEASEQELLKNAVTRAQIRSLEPSAGLVSVAITRDYSLNDDVRLRHIG